MKMALCIVKLPRWGRPSPFGRGCREERVNEFRTEEKLANQYAKINVLARVFPPSRNSFTRSKRRVRVPQLSQIHPHPALRRHLPHGEGLARQLAGLFWTVFNQIPCCIADILNGHSIHASVIDRTVAQ